MAPPVGAAWGAECFVRVFRVHDSLYCLCLIVARRFSISLNFKIKPKKPRLGLTWRLLSMVLRCRVGAAPVMRCLWCCLVFVYTLHICLLAPAENAASFFFLPANLLLN